MNEQFWRINETKSHKNCKAKYLYFELAGKCLKSLLLYPVPFMKRSPLREKALDALEEHLDTVAGLSFSKVTESCEDLLDDGRDERDD